jgi:hypothetical protein
VGRKTNSTIIDKSKEKSGKKKKQSNCCVKSVSAIQQNRNNPAVNICQSYVFEQMNVRLLDSHDRFERETSNVRRREADVKLTAEISVRLTKKKVSFTC